MFVGGISMKIVNLRKFIRSIMILLFLIFGISVFFSKATLSYKQLEYEIICVEHGDTLLKIAEKQKESNEYYKRKDIRDIVYDIKKVNNLNSSDIYVAQELKIPSF